MNDLVNKLQEIFAEDPDSLIRDHKEAMSCWNLEAVLEIGVILYKSIKRFHEEWHRRVEMKELEYRIEDAEAHAEEYKRWLSNACRWLERAKAFEEQGYHVKHAGELRSLCDEVLEIEADLNVRENSKRLARMESGSGLTLSEFFDGLRSNNR